MKFKTSLIFLLITFFIGHSQGQATTKKSNNKGKLYLYWGWNWEWYGRSNINFKGDNYNFTLKKVRAKDRQTDFKPEKYFNPGNATIPQFNFRIGYFINDKYNISFGLDHMKYVIKSWQTVKISGNISGTGTLYDGTYTNDDIVITPDFLKFEHTNGLNYINFDFRRLDEIIALNKIKINLTEGLGAGILLPKTNTTLLNNERYDEFNLAGYGINAMVGINATFWDFFFIQSEFKGGFINMPNIRTSISTSDSAKQNFSFYQVNVVFGTTINLAGNKNK